jgi:heparan-alpha-glucosaminide N-acetyltransferase
MVQVKRLNSIDVFRAVNMFFMVFVNDISDVQHIPAWIDHAKANEDGLHFADTIFPIFLFIAGLSIPLAICRRLNKGNSIASIAGYIILRSFALIVMGFLHVNMDNYSDAALLPEAIWELLLTLSFFLIWLDYSDTLSKIKRYALTGSGIAILIFLAIVFKGGTAAHPVGLSPSWWGILGIIGWAYLVSALLFLFTKGKLSLLLIFLGLFVALNIGLHASLFDINTYVINDGSSISLMLLGIVISLVYNKMAKEGNYNKLWRILSFIGSSMIAVGFILRPYTQGISKIHSTPAWTFICGGIGVTLFALLIWLVDAKEKQNWFRLIKPAGTSTLTCYLLPYLIFAIFQILNVIYPYFLNNGVGGILRSFAVAFAVIFITGFLEKRKLRLHI